MRDDSRLDRLVETLRTIDQSFALGLGYLFLAATAYSREGANAFTVACAGFGVVFVALGLRRGGPFRRAPDAETGRVPSGRRHAGPVWRILAAIIGTAGMVLALWSARDGDWFAVPYGLLIGAACLLVAATGGGRVWIDPRPSEDAAAPPA